ncbi:RNA polymerase sigma factor [Nocardia crassostreae]|uniref:RNA polymerase sigma factor n=1 Tax=Nocardia crassostreae TaxID=53428 RepID=UPI000835EE08|nr:RNA polymerase sigma factor [Nocardia crassostreae]
MTPYLFPDGFERFFRARLPEVKTWIVRDLGRHGTAEVDDIAHEVMLAVLDKATRQGAADVALVASDQWLRAVARNKTVDTIRRSWRTAPVSPETFADHAGSPAASGEDEVLAQELLVSAMGRLSSRQREIVSRSASGFSIAEITRLLGYDSEATVRHQLYRARRIVRELITGTRPASSPPAGRDRS